MPTDLSENMAASKECDLVMKGGITSGIIYPPLVIRLHKDGYSFRKIGGTSAGAIAAAVTAAAECGKATAGFQKLDEIRNWLSKKGNLRGLFQPTKKTAALMNTLFGYSEKKSLNSPVLRLIVAFLQNNPWAILVGLLMGTILAFIFVGLVGGSFSGWGTIVLILSASLGGVLVGLLHLLRILLKTVPANGFGMCTGRSEDTQKMDETVLTDWLSASINDLGGKRKEDAPLIFSDLWGTRNPKKDEKKIDLRLMTSNLSQNQPCVLPFENDLYIFKDTELAKLFPSNVVEHMVKTARRCQGLILPDGYYFLPDAKDLPVVFATRLSLSFPVLISMVKLYTIGYKALALKNNIEFRIVEEPKVGGRNVEEAETEKVIMLIDNTENDGKAVQGNHVFKLEPSHLKPNWFSDGGICSNFPIHFFDAWLPTRPTFGVNLTSQLAEEADGAGSNLGKNISKSYMDRIMERSTIVANQSPVDVSRPTTLRAACNDDVYLPDPRDILPVEWIPIKGLGKFFESIFRTAQNYRDNMQASLPSYRERIVQIRLTDEEGGLNLDMDFNTIKAVVDKGAKAGQKLIDHFQMEEHQWVRFLVLMKRMEESLGKMNVVLSKNQNYIRLIQSQYTPKCYPPSDPNWFPNVVNRLNRFTKEITGWHPPDLFAQQNPAPSPEPVLRVTPEV